MASIFRRLHRLRKLEERTAQVALAEAHAHRESCQAEVVQLEDRLSRSFALADTSAALMVQHHRFSLDGELARQSAERDLATAREQVTVAHRDVVQRATVARTVELLAETAEERASSEARAHEQRMIDEVGAQRWLRRAS